MSIRDDEGVALLSENELADLRDQWQSVQAGFVDEPRGALQEADRLVNNAMDQLTVMFSQERERLETTWHKGDEVSTEDLRVALQRYRAFFERLLSV